KRLPLVNRYVEDPTALLVRPNCERNRQCFAEGDLFEPGRAVLTAQGRQRLDDLGPWLEGMKHKGSEVVVVAYADPRGSLPPSAPAGGGAAGGGVRAAPAAGLRPLRGQAGRGRGAGRLG